VTAVGSPRFDEEREAVGAQIAALERDLADVVASSQLVATDDEHDPEGSTIAFERARVDALLKQARKTLGEIDRAQQRLTTGEYGVCERCGRRIPEERLEARPTAATCVGCAAQ
jgi:RNA polymerase-binding transcription factor DksA